MLGDGKLSRRFYDLNARIIKATPPPHEKNIAQIRNAKGSIKVQAALRISERNSVKSWREQSGPSFSVSLFISAVPLVPGQAARSQRAEPTYHSANTESGPVHPSLPPCSLNAASRHKAGKRLTDSVVCCVSLPNPPRSGRVKGQQALNGSPTIAPMKRGSQRGLFEASEK